MTPNDTNVRRDDSTEEEPRPSLPNGAEGTDPVEPVPNGVNNIEPEGPGPAEGHTDNKAGG